jgi:hypothetical protein
MSERATEITMLYHRKAKTAETRKRTFVLSWMRESENHMEGAEPGDATGKRRVPLQT